jgi:protease-4
MASSAYWISVGADMIIAEQSANVGSIGVYSALIDSSRAFEMNGLKRELFKTGKYKAMGIQGLPLTEDQKKLIQSRADQLFDWFSSSVIEARVNVDDAAMQGQPFRGQEAKDVNLVDLIGSKEDAFDLLQELILAKK